MRSPNAFGEVSNCDGHVLNGFSERHFKEDQLLLKLEAGQQGRIDVNIPTGIWPSAHRRA